MSLIDTAEMYADGDAEVLVGEAIKGRREQVFLVSKTILIRCSSHLMASGTSARPVRDVPDRRATVSGAPDAEWTHPHRC
jgi:aryl-alcohol dehydrogenase-like predicted oxidoreductase